MKNGYIAHLLCFLAIIIISNESLSGQGCQGTTIFNESFDDGIPASWVVLNFDTNTLYWNFDLKGFTGQWQAFNHLGNACVANADRYQNAYDKADDYLISPGIYIPAAPVCLSWKSGSAGPFYGSEYDVLVSTTTPTVPGFQANPVLLHVTPESELWNTHQIALDDYAGQTVYIAFYDHSDGFAIFIDEIHISQPVQSDVLITSSTPAQVVATGSYPLSATILNGGTDQVNEVELLESVDGETPFLFSFSNLDLQPGESATLSLSSSLVLSDVSTRYIKYQISSVNGQPDQNPINDTLIQTVWVSAQPRKTFVEEFTQSSCEPCAYVNPAFDELLFIKRFQQKITVIKYHSSWPGVDPMFDLNPEASNERVSFYGITGVPGALADGLMIDCGTYSGNPTCLTSVYLDSLSAIPSPFTIQIVDSFGIDSGYVNVTVTSLFDIPFPALTLRTMVLEDTISFTQPPGTNGETVFNEVMRKGLPDMHGIVLGTMSAGESDTFYFSFPLLPEYNVPMLKSIAFIQDDQTWKIYQSEISDTISAFVSGVPVSESGFSIHIFPNPVDEILHVQVSESDSKNAFYSIRNIMGMEVMSGTLNRSNAGEISLKHFSEGIYLITINKGDSLLGTRSFIVSHIIN